jgi:hypothetical protein
MGLSCETEKAKSVVHHFLSIFLHYLGSKIPLLLSRNVEVLHHVARGTSFECSSNSFSREFHNTGLLNIP